MAAISRYKPLLAMAKAGQAWVPASSSSRRAANRNAYVATDRRDFRPLPLDESGESGEVFDKEEEEEEEEEEGGGSCGWDLGSSKRS